MKVREPKEDTYSSSLGNEIYQALYPLYSLASLTNHDYGCDEMNDFNLVFKALLEQAGDELVKITDSVERSIGPIEITRVKSSGHVVKVHLKPIPEK